MILNRAAPNEELNQLIALFLKAEADIINEISRLRSRGLADYHVEAALVRVQAILRELENDCWTYTPRMIERQFYVRHPELRAPETQNKHRNAYLNASTLTSEQTDIVNRLTINLMGQIAQASATANASMTNILLGRTQPDIFRKVGLEQTALAQAKGQGVFKPVKDFVETLRREGVTAFVDRAGRRWNLHTYGSMVLRTTSRQAEVMSVLTQNPEHDLYLISSHGSTCSMCAPLEGRVYSKSGGSRDFPPLTAAFGRQDPNGPDTLENSWLNIHPNCLHQIIRWTEMGRSEEEIQKIKDFSSFEKNPPTRDPRSEKQITAYREKEAARARYLRDRKQWENYRSALGDKVPKTFETFQQHKMAKDDKYKEWSRLYREPGKFQLERVLFTGGTPEEQAGIEAELIKIPQKARDLAEQHITKISIVNGASSSYNPKTGELRLGRSREPGTVAHEYGHAIETSLHLYENPEFLKIRNRGFENIQPSDIIIDTDNFSQKIFRVWHPKFVSMYQGRLYSRYGIYDGSQVYLDGMREYFSEGFMFYIMEPDTLRQKDREFFDYIRRLLE